jgi:ABC-type transport system involved in multi-copper enzyme maturation permease subunit
VRNIIKITLNELKKFIRSKKFYVLCFLIIGLALLAVYAYNEMAQNVMTNSPKIKGYSEELKTILVNLNGTNFARLFLTDFIYKNFFSIFIIFILLISIDIFGIDKEIGTFKFTLLTGVKVWEVYIGKIVAIALISLAIVSSNLITSFALGQIFFDTNFNVQNFSTVVLLYLSSVIPAIIISLLIAILCLSKVSSKVLTIVGILFVFIFGTVDSLTITKYFSPIGLLSVFSDCLPQINRTFTQCLSTAITYIIILSLSLIITSKKVDYFN